MPLGSGTVDVGGDLAQVCAVASQGVRVRNLGTVTVWFGGPDITAEPDGPGFPLEPGESETFPGVTAKETPLVPAPSGDLDPPQLYARTAGTAAKIAWFSSGG